jgi:polar amino acid transport system substrate-binding protein
LLHLKNGEIDGVFQILNVAEREAFVDYSKIVLIDETVNFFVLEDSHITFENDFDKLKDYTIGVRQDFSYGSKFDQAVKDKVFNKILTTTRQDKFLRLLSSGHINILIGDKYNIPYTYEIMKTAHQNEQYKNIKRLSPSVQDAAAYMAFSKINGLSAVRDSFDEALLKMKDDGTYDKIIEGWENSH